MFRPSLEYPPGQIPPLSESLRLYHDEDRPAVVAALEGVLREGRPVDFSSVRIRTAKGRWLDVRVTGRPVFDEQGYVIKAIGSLQDITDWKLAQQEAVRLSNRLYKTLESVTDSFFMVDRNWCLSYMNQEAGRVLQVSRESLIGQVIWEAFPGSYESEIGQRYRGAIQTMEPQHFESYYPPMARWFEVHVLLDLDAAIEESQAEVRVDTLPPVYGDAMQLRQVMQNLLSNALKFRASDRRPALHVTVEAEDANGWTLAISDNGIGFDEKYLDKIFAPFQRLHARDAYPGTGIGLAIVKKIVEMHGARIMASSTPGQGATFRIKFPPVTHRESKS